MNENLIRMSRFGLVGNDYSQVMMPFKLTMAGMKSAEVFLAAQNGKGRNKTQAEFAIKTKAITGLKHPWLSQHEISRFVLFYSIFLLLLC